MSNIAYNILEEQIILSQKGRHFVVNREEDSSLYKEVKELIKSNNLQEAIDILDIEKVYEKAGFQVVDGRVVIDNEQLPQLLSERILKYHKEKLPFEPLIKFWENLKSNPSYRARQDLYSFLSHNGHPFTEEGCFIAYKAVREDFKDIHSGTMDNSVGEVVVMDRTRVDDNPNNTCSSGLHFGAWDYVQDFGRSNGHILEIKVNPKDVVSIPTDYNNQKGRCCKFEVLSVVEQKQETDTLHNHIESEEYIHEYECECEECGAEFDKDELLKPDYENMKAGDVLPLGRCPHCENDYSEY